MSEWRYNNLVEIHFGSGIIDNLPDFVLGKAVLVTTPGTTRRGISRKISKLLNSSLVALFDKVEPNPTFETITDAYIELKQVEYDLIIAVGGGSVLDTAKGVTALDVCGSDEGLKKYLKDGFNIPKDFDPKPVIAIPTTAGTGSEVTMWATIWDMEEKKKYSLSHPKLYPEIALLDPELTLSLPEKETIYSGLDALSHAMEAIWNKNHNPISDMLALKAISLIYTHLPLLCNDLNNLDLRSYLLYASLLAGLAFSNTKTALAHAISYPLTAHFGIPHGLACSLPLLHLLKFNGTRNLERVENIAKALNTEKKLHAMIKALENFFRAIGISPYLSKYGVNRDQVHLIMKTGLISERAKNNIVNVNSNELFMILEDLYRKI